VDEKCCFCSSKTAGESDGKNDGFAAALAAAFSNRLQTRQVGKNVRVDRLVPQQTVATTDAAQVSRRSRSRFHRNTVNLKKNLCYSSHSHHFRRVPLPYIPIKFHYIMCLGCF
jgi:hypothetical protein